MGKGFGRNGMDCLAGIAEVMEMQRGLFVIRSELRQLCLLRFRCSLVRDVFINGLTSRNRWGLQVDINEGKGFGKNGMDCFGWNSGSNGKATGLFVIRSELRQLCLLRFRCSSVKDVFMNGLTGRNRWGLHVM
ncbi:hypothetical protein CEXT_74471 [Caerostris extrusa]|uniref:Uncharacterized protein n=1 Tax=Caerostris extrusa TaxID=172846 RepID=A0AAV4VER9_CAEEX|nr:hypothetical protein CEXT_74471 [Caerostris extrusa]